MSEDMEQLQKSMNDTIRLLHVAFEAVSDTQGDIEERAKEFVTDLLEEMIRNARRARVMTTLAAQTQQRFEEIMAEEEAQEESDSEFASQVRASLEDLPLTEEQDGR